MLAEVSDKIPAVAEFWCLHLAAAALLAFAARRAVLFVLLPLAVAWATLFIVTALDGNDPLRPTVVAEMGRGYYAHQVLSSLTPAVVIGLLLSGRRRVTQPPGFEVVKLETPNDPGDDALN